MLIATKTHLCSDTEHNKTGCIKRLFEARRWTKLIITRVIAAVAGAEISGEVNSPVAIAAFEIYEIASV